MSYLDKFKLPNTSKKLPCPQCGKRTFKPYVHADTGDPVNQDAFGRCDRENDCGYHVKPDAKKKDEAYVVNTIFPAVDILKTLSHKKSPLHSFLISKGIPEEFLYTNGVCEERGLTVYVFNNAAGKFCNLKYFKYGENGKRDHAFNSFSLKNPPRRNQYIDERYTMPLFGEHELDPEKKKIVCIVESEKSRVIAKFHYPEFDWVACGSANGLSDGSEGTADKIKPLKDRTVYWVCDNDKAARGKFMVDDKGKEVWRDCSSVRNGKKHIKDFHIVDLFKDNDEGYDIGDALLDGLKPEIKPTWSALEQDPRYKSYIPPTRFKSEAEYRSSIVYGETSSINEEFDSTYSWMRTHVNAFYGWPKDGKSLMLEFLSLVKAKKSGWKTCMFKQEDLSSYNGMLSADNIYNKLAWMLTGITPLENFSKKHKTELLAWDKLNEAKEWVKKHIFIINPSNRKYNMVMDEFLYFKEVFGIDHFAVDPWNTMILDDKERGDERLIQAFIRCKDVAQKTNTVMSLVNHPGSRHDQKEKSGAFKVVNQFMQLGGSAWDIKMDGQFSIHRPFRHKAANDPYVHLYNLNQRDSEFVGAERGVYKKIEFDRTRRQYYFDGVCPIDGSKKESKQPSPQTELPYEPTWRKKKKKESYEEHLQNWAQPATDDVPF